MSKSPIPFLSRAPLNTVTAGHYIPIQAVGGPEGRVNAETLVAGTELPGKVEALSARMLAAEQALAVKANTAELRSLVAALLEEMTQVEPPPATATLAAPTFSPQSVSIPANTPEGTALFTLSDLPAGAGRGSLSPGDGRVRFRAGSNQTVVEVGSTALSPTSLINVTCMTTLSGAVGSPVVTTMPLTITAAVGTGELPQNPPVTTLAYAYEDREKPAVAAPASGLAVTPAVLATSATGDVQGFNFNAKGRAIPQCYGAFALFFERGKVMPGDPLEYVREGTSTATPVQYKGLKFWPDGSVYHARLYCQRPALTAGQTIRVMLRKASSALSGTALDHSGLASVPLTGSWAITRTYTFSRYIEETGVVETNGPVDRAWNNDIGAAAIAAATAEAWEAQGPIASERRYIIDLQHALRVPVDVIKFVDGTWQFHIAFASDKLFWANPDDVRSWVININLSLSGTPIYAVSNFRLGIGQMEVRKINTGKSPAQNAQRYPVEHNIQVDAPLYTQMTAFPPIGYDLGINASDLAAAGSEAVQNSTTYRPFEEVGTTRNMGGVGGRTDIGVVPNTMTIWAITQDIDARDVMMRMGDTSGIVPWNFYDPNHKITLNTFPETGYPDFWMDGRHDRNPPNTTTPDTWNRWSVDFAHQPMLSYMPYVVTGDRFYRERLEVQANNSYVYMYPPGRNAFEPDKYQPYVLMQNGQTREAGWCLVHTGMGILGLPDTSPFQPLLRRAAEENFRCIHARIPNYTNLQGETKGYLLGAGDGKVEMRCWEDAHVIVGVATMYFAGIRGALEYLQWAENFHIERFFQQAKGLTWQRANMFSYLMGGNLGNPDSNPPDVTTWAEFSAAGIVPAGTQLDANGLQPDINIHAIQMRTDGYYATIFPSLATKCQTINDLFVNANASYTSPSYFRREPLEYMRPIPLKAGRTGPSTTYAGSPF